MGDDEAGLVLHQGAHGLLDAAFGAGVDVAGGLVEDQHFGVVEHCAGDGEELLLALRNISAVLGDHGVIALGQAHDVMVDVGGFGRLDHLFARCADAAVGDVVVDGAVEDPGVLQHQRVCAAQRFHRKVLVGHVIHINLAGDGLVEAHQQVDDGCLAGAGGPDDGNHLARLGVEIHVAEDGLFRAVGEIDVLELDFAADLRKLLGVLEVGDLIGLV